MKVNLTHIEAIWILLQRRRPDITIADPACETTEFLVFAYEWLLAQTKGALDRGVAKRAKTNTYFGQELVTRTRMDTWPNGFGLRA